MTSFNKKLVAIEVRGHKATAFIKSQGALAVVIVKSEGSQATTTCHPRKWRQAAAQLVLRIHHKFDTNRVISKEPLY